MEWDLQVRPPYIIIIIIIMIIIMGQWTDAIDQSIDWNGTCRYVPYIIIIIVIVVRAPID